MIEHTSIALTSMNMQAFTTSMQESNSSFHHILHNLDVLCHLVRPLSPAPSQWKVHLSLALSLSLSRTLSLSLSISLSLSLSLLLPAPKQL